MSNTDTTMLDDMLEDMANAHAHFRPTAFWEAASKKLIDEIRQVGIASFKSREMPLRFFVPTYGFPGYHRNTEQYDLVHSALDQCSTSPKRLKLRLDQLISGEQQAMADYRTFLASQQDIVPYLNNISESQVGAPLEQFVFNGCRYSRSFLNYMLGINFLKQHCDTTGIRRVAEIGGGHGALGELLLGDDRNQCFYLDIDIPPVSHIATWYLQQIFGESRIYSYGESRGLSAINLDDIAGKYSAAVICPWQLQALDGEIDLFVNFVSFQEMEPDVVANYLALIDRLKPRYILLRNMREGKQIAHRPGEVGVKRPILGPDYDTFLPQYSLKATNVMPFGHVTEDGFHSELRLYVRHPG